ncbi:hypothetical protein AGMMS49525_11920 [Bacteroidia bacterium]|nr:hypothetical protein AGMMS49525_11920 [Bacteroidia bacterium]
MKRLINIIGVIALCGILLKLSYVFVFLFGELDNNSLISRIFGISFGFSSLYFVIKVPKQWVKIVMISLDVATIIYFYIHEKMNITIEYSSIIIAAYSALIIYFLGQIVSEQIHPGTGDTSPVNNQELEYRLSMLREVKQLEAEIQALRKGGKSGRHADDKNKGQFNLFDAEEK